MTIGDFFLIAEPALCGAVERVGNGLTERMMDVGVLQNREVSK